MRGKSTNTMVKAITAGMLSFLVAACGSNASTAAQNVTGSEVNQTSTETVNSSETVAETNTAEPVVEAAKKIEISDVYSLIGSTSSDTATSMVDIDRYGLNSEVHFNSDYTGVLMYGDEVIGFTYDDDGHMTEDPSVATEESNNLDFAVQGDYVFLLQTSKAGGYQGVMVFKRTAD